ncbi:MAG: acyl-CoA dehydrogenase family protein [Acidimicrobiales bacterium]
MDFELGQEAESLRLHLRELIGRHLPAQFLGAFTDDPEDLETTRRFCKILASEGLLALAWPTEFGGGGASVWEQTVLREEMWAHHEPRGPQYMGLNWIGPAIMRFGTESQQRLHLPLISGGEAIWCQGFSEPDAGSDLASLRTAARREDGGWRVSGQKIWTSYAQVADWCFLAARTGPPESRREGISVFLVPMDRPGIEVRPIANLLGPYHLNEVFFEDVHVGPGELLGAEDEGWQVIRAALAFERVGIARYARGERLLGQVRAAGGGLGSLPAPLRARYAGAMVHNRVARLMAYEVIAGQTGGTASDADAAAARIAAVTADQEASDVLVEAIGPSVFDSAPGGETHLNAAVEDYWRYSRAATVAAGSVDIQRILVAQGALGA